VQLQDLIDEVTQDNPSMPEFVERLQQQGVEVQVTLTGIGFSKGISYNLDGVALSGTQLGKAYTFLDCRSIEALAMTKGEITP
jgi:hypothetical protein